MKKQLKIVTKKELLSNLGQYVLQYDYTDIYELLDFAGLWGLLSFK